MTNSITLSAELIVDQQRGTSCGYHRLQLPYARLKVRPAVPVLVFNRLYSQGYAHLNRMKAAGARIIADIDDSPFLNAGHYLYDNYAKHHTAVRVINELTLADVITVTNTRLADTVRRVLPKARIEVVPNSLPFDEGQFVRNTEFEHSHPAVYAAGPSHYADTKLLPLGIEGVAFAGDHPHPEWQKIRETFPQAAYKPALPVDEYMRLYNGHKIALAPLKPNDFNACKSNLKMLEAGAAGVAFIASPVDPYIDDADYPFVVYASEKSSWTKTIAKQLQGTRWSDTGAALAQHVRENYHIDHVNKIRRQIIESLR